MLCWCLLVWRVYVTWTFETSVCVIRFWKFTRKVNDSAALADGKLTQQVKYVFGYELFKQKVILTIFFVRPSVRMVVCPYVRMYDITLAPPIAFRGTCLVPVLVKILSIWAWTLTLERGVYLWKIRVKKGLGMEPKMHCICERFLGWVKCKQRKNKVKKVVISANK